MGLYSGFVKFNNQGRQKSTVLRPVMGFTVEGVVFPFRCYKRDTFSDLITIAGFVEGSRLHL